MSYTDLPETIEFLQPPKEVMSVIQDILEQNRLIIIMNKDLLRVMSAPPLVVHHQEDASK